MNLTQQRLKELLDYDPETGIFVWRVNRRGAAKAGEVAGCLDKDGYWIITVDNKLFKAHRLAFLWMDGYLPENFVDHKDRIRINNAYDNLREASPSCNSRNCKISISNKSGVTGVYWHKQRNKWDASIKTHEKQITLGRFNYFIDAVKARWEAEVKYGFPNCNTTSSAYNCLKGYGQLLSIAIDTLQKEDFHGVS